MVHDATENLKIESMELIGLETETVAIGLNDSNSFPDFATKESLNAVPSSTVRCATVGRMAQLVKRGELDWCSFHSLSHS